MPDIKRLINEVSAENGIRIEPEDPLFALVTINRIVLDEAAEKFRSVVEAQLAEFHKDVEKAEKRAGSMLAQTVRESAEQMRNGLKSDIQIAGLKATEYVHLVHEAHRRPALMRYCALGMMAGILLFGCGVWFGTMLH